MKVEMPHAYIVAAKRSPFVKAREKDKAFHGMHPVDLVSYVAKKTFDGVKEGTSLSEKDVEDVVLGLVTKVGKQAFDPARFIGIRAFGIHVPGQTIDRLCGSSLQALNTATDAIKAGSADVLVVTGLEDMKEVPIGCDMLPPPVNLANITSVATKKEKAIFDSLPEWFNFNETTKSGMLVAKKYGLTRQELDEYAVMSQNRAYEAKEKGYFKDEIIPIPVPGGAVIFEDDGIRKSTIEDVSKLKTVSPDNEFITAGNSSQKTAGAAAIILVSDKIVEKFGLKPLAEVIAHKVVADDPEVQLDSPIYAIPAVLERAGLKLEDIDRIEINEAFASVPLACIKTLGLDKNKVNVQGGAIALGHPLGASGARLITTLIYQLQREKLNYGLAALCIGAGQANATIIKRI